MRLEVRRGRPTARQCVEPPLPDGIWEILEPLIPPAPKRVQGGGKARIDDRAVLAAIAFVLTRGCAWRSLPADFAVSHQTAHRRFAEWSQAGLWSRIHREVVDRPGTASQIEWARVIAWAALDRCSSARADAPNPSGHDAAVRDRRGTP